MRDNKIDSTSDFTSRGLGELKAWLEPWFLGQEGASELEWEDVGAGATGLETTDGVIDVNPTRLLSIGTGITLTNPATGEAHIIASGAGGGGITEITSVDGSISIGSPTGPTVDLSVVIPSTGIFFNHQPQSGSWLQILTTGTIPSGAGTGAGIYMEAAGPAYLIGQAGLILYGGTNSPASISVSDGVGGSFTFYIDPLLSGAGSPGFQVSAGSGLSVPLLRIVRVGGTWSYHIKSGATWVADL